MKIACLGDSITYYGSPGTAFPFPQVLQKLLTVASPGTHLVANHGVHGDKVTAGITTRYGTDIKLKGYDALVFLGGINDVAADVSAASIESAAQAILDDARGRGMTVVIIGMSPFGGDSTDYTAPRETTRQNVNTSYSNWAATNSVPFINLDTQLGDGGSPVKLQSQYAYLDGLHILQPACDLIAAQIETALGL